MGAPIATPRKLASRLSAVAALVFLAGCGGGHHVAAAARTTPTHPRPKPAAPAPVPTPSQTLRPGSRKHVAIVKAWSDSLRAGHIHKASSYFALPLVVQNGTPPITLTTKLQVVGFNVSLPCGARVVRAVTDGGRYTIVVFKLTERKGKTPGCGSGTGQTAATAFAFRNGKISEWRRSSIPPKVESQVAA